MQMKSLKRHIGVWVCMAMLATLLALRLLPKESLAEHWPSSTAIYAEDGSLLRLSLASDEQYRVWTPLERMPTRLIEAVKLYEDQWFDWHPGVNPVALVRAAVSTFTGAHKQGASTLTMQLARKRYGLNTRSASGKLQQMGYALWLEARYSKHELLEAYLNIAPYGRNVEGVGAASLVYFHTAVQRLNIAQVLTLAVVPQNPRLRNPALATSTQLIHSQQQARERLWQRWLANHHEDERMKGDALATVKLYAPETLPYKTPHLTDILLKGYASLPMNNMRKDINTLLSMHAQQTLERSMAQALESQAALGVRNAAAMLVDARSGDVKGYVGSANYFDETIEGQVNGITAKRSPGSTLKPFIYALALDQGLIHPRSVLKDAPTAFGPFSPENFDGRFAGPITAQEALVRSRNVPAVELSSRLAAPSLHSFLKSAGVSQLKSERHYGLALALGGAELSMEELATLYATLANKGRYTPLRYTKDAKQADTTTQLISEEAAYITLQMLEQNPRPDTQLPASPAIAWKTGTSWGFHDAWTAGVIGHHVLVVWVGNFDNAANPAFVGIQTAAPMFLRMADSLRAQGLITTMTSAPPPAGVRKVAVCAASGDLPNALCPHTVNTLFIAGKSPIRMSTLHRAQWVDAQGQAACAGQSGAIEQVFEYWPSDLATLFRQAGMPRRAPPHERACDSSAVAAVNAEPPRITSPLRGSTYTLRISTQQAQVPLVANTAAATHEVFWFANNAFVGKSQAGQSLMWQPPAAGRYTLRAVDETGASDSRELLVEYVS
jgi:penicillin-binding protein 1C